FVNEAGFDYRLTLGSPLIGRGGTAHPPEDIDGKKRPVNFPADAGASQWDPAVMVLGRSIGMVRIGETQDEVTAFYGPPRSSKAKGALTLATYALHGAYLTVSYAGGEVVGIGTTTPYYATVKGYAVGSPAPKPLGTWLPCRRSFQRKAGKVALFTSL